MRRRGQLDNLRESIERVRQQREAVARQKAAQPFDDERYRADYAAALETLGRDALNEMMMASVTRQRTTQNTGMDASNGTNG